MLSSGGIATVETAPRFPIRLIESGPAAGALAAAYFGRLIGAPEPALASTWAAPPPRLCLIEDGQPLDRQRLRGRSRVPLQEGQRPADQGRR